jgi:hypothetical protein
MRAAGCQSQLLSQCGPYLTIWSQVKNVQKILNFMFPLTLLLAMDVQSVENYMFAL